MNIILGASGQVGSHLVKELVKYKTPVRAIVRKTNVNFDDRVELRRADIFDFEQLKQAFAGGSTVFLLTPEDPASQDIISDTIQLIDLFRGAIRSSGIRRVVGLSCVGAQVAGNTGNIVMSRLLEQGFRDLNVEQVFIRPSYFFSNWLVYLEAVKEQGILPTFFPEDLQIDMNFPRDVAEFVAKVMLSPEKPGTKTVFELIGPARYTSRDVAQTFEKLLHRTVAVQPIPKEQWQDTLFAAGFSDNTAANLIEMTNALIAGVAGLENPERALPLPTTLEEFLGQHL